MMWYPKRITGQYTAAKPVQGCWKQRKAKSFGTGVRRSDAWVLTIEHVVKMLHMPLHQQQWTASPKQRRWRGSRLQYYGNYVTIKS